MTPLNLDEVPEFGRVASKDIRNFHRSKISILLSSRLRIFYFCFALFIGHKTLSGLFLCKNLRSIEHGFVSNRLGSCRCPSRRWWGRIHAFSLRWDSRAMGAARGEMHFCLRISVETLECAPGRRACVLGWFRIETANPRIGSRRRVDSLSNEMEAMNT